MNLRDQVAIVTGGSRGIGHAICLRLVREGATVVACARDMERLQALADEAVKSETPGTIVPWELDVTDGPAIERCVDGAAEREGRIDILVNNAGITRDGPMMSMEDEQFDSVLEANLRAVFRMTRAVCPHMVRARKGRIINIASISGITGRPGQANYAASKAGLIGFTKSVARELAKCKITCNVVAPGFVTTDMTDVLPEAVKDNVRMQIPMQRFGEPTEVSGIVAFLAGPEATYITGEVIRVDGGLAM